MFNITRLSFPFNLATRRVWSVSIAIALSLVVDHFYSALQQYWVPLVTVILLLISPQVSIRKLVLSFFVLCLLLSLALLLVNYVPAHWLRVCSFALLLSALSLDAFSKNIVKYALPLSIPAILILLLAPYWPLVAYQKIFYDVMLAGGLGFVTVLVLYGERAGSDFREEILPIFSAYQDYLDAIIKLFLKTTNPQFVEEQQFKVSHMLQSERSQFPVWVYEASFNPALRKGHRHFILRTENIGRILFVLHYLAKKSVHENLRDEFSHVLRDCGQDEKLLMQRIIAILKTNKNLQAPHVETTSLIDYFQQNAPQGWELLESANDYVTLSAFFYQLHDLRENLLKLLEALR